MKRLIQVFASDRFWFRLIILWIVVLAILYSSLSVLRHVHFQSGAFDLGVFDQAVWQYSHFLYPYNTIKDRLILGDHFTLTLPLLSFLYWIWDNVKILLIFQAVFISFSTIAIYKITRIRKFSSFVCFCISVIYSIFWGIQFAVYFDFHPILIGVGLFTWLLYFLEAKKKKLFILTLILVLLTQEDMGFALAAVGIIYFFRKNFRKVSFLFICIGIISSLTEIKIIAALSPVGFEYTPVFPNNPLGFVRDLFNDPQKIQVWAYSLGWFSFLPLFSLSSILAIASNLAQFFVTGDQFSRMWSPFMHHRAILSIFLFLGTLNSLEYVKKLNKKYLNLNLIVILLVLSTLFQQFIFHFPLNKLSKLDYWKNESWVNDNNKLFSFLPADASVAASQNLVPHISHRNKIFLIYPRIKNNICNGCWWLEFAGKPQYLVVDLHPNQWITQLLESNENFNSAIRNMEQRGKIAKYKNINDAYIFKINY